MASLLANFFPITNISKFIPEDYYVASLLANFLRSPMYGQLACEFFSNHQYFQVYPRRLLCGQLACHFSGFLYMASLLADFFPNHFMKYFEIYPRRFIIWPACLPFSISAN